jgi:ATP-dependent helicase/nuclease subunit A
MSLDNHIALDTARRVVEACAGSGKTWLLSSRIARALLEGTPPREILALTFTNKAAAEMRTRVIGHLKEMTNLSDDKLEIKLREWGLAGDALTKAMVGARDLLARYLLDPQPPVIATFHSWYVRIAAMAPLSLAGIATRSLSQRSWDLMRQAWKLFYAEEMAHLPYAALVASMGGSATRQAMENWVQNRVEWAAFGQHLALDRMSPNQAREVLSQAEHLNQQAIQTFFQEQSESAARLAKAFAQCDGRELFCEMLTRWQPSDLDALVKFLFAKIEPNMQLDSTETPPARYRLKGGSHVLIRKGTELKKWGVNAAQYSAEVESLVNALITLLDTNSARLLQAQTQALWLCGKALVACLDRVMAKTNEIDFTGLELTAWHLMGGQASAGFHERLDQTISHVLVDEFQDTNPVQWAMLREWLGQYVQADQVLRAQAPKVFLVGDPKQSIYRFRRADPQVFRVASDWLCQHYGATVLPTNTTRRCGPQVVDFLNAAMPGADPSHRYQTHESQTSDRQGFVAKLPVASDWSAEGALIAQALAHIKSEHAELQWSDMRILVRSRTHMAGYEQALAKAGIPFVSDRTGGLLKEPEIRDVIALLRCLAFPWSDVDCAHALKSPIFGCSDTELARIAAVTSTDGPRSFYEKLSILANAPNTATIVKEAHAALSQWMSWSDQLPVHDLLDRIIHRQDVFERMAGRFAQGRGVQCIANLEAFLTLALDLDTGRFPSLARFLQELHRWSQVKDADAPGPGVMPSTDAVMLSTIHSAKGLEADVVVLAGLLDRDKSDAGMRWLVDWNDARDQVLGVAAWCSGEPMNPTVKRALLDDRRQSDDEDFNLLYVGCTRARRFLVFSATEGGKNVDKKWFTKVADHCDEMELPANAPQTLAPSALTWRGMRFEKHGDGAIVRPAPESLAVRQGKALHRLLEFGPAIAPNQRARLMAPFALPKDAQAEVMDAVERISRSDLSAQIFSRNQLSYAEREWPTADGIARPDRIIRISEDPETWWIIDFKWQVLESEISDYAKQLAHYQTLMQSIRPQAAVKAMILTSLAECWPLVEGRLLSPAQSKSR